MNLLILFGKAGSGKDTIGGYIAKEKNCATIALADPMKRFVRNVFGFTESQLWGPSEYRNGGDPRFLIAENWKVLSRRMDDLGYEWCQDIYPSNPFQAHRALMQWFDDLYYKYFGTGISPRTVLQTIGTEFGRALSDTLWVDYVIRTAKECLENGYGYSRTSGLYHTKTPPEAIIVTDGRFFNELRRISNAGGRSALIKSQTKELQAGVKGHVSEQEINSIPEDVFDFIVDNDKSKGLEYAWMQAKALANEAFKTV